MDLPWCVCRAVQGRDTGQCKGKVGQEVSEEGGGEKAERKKQRDRRGKEKREDLITLKCGKKNPLDKEMYGSLHSLDMLYK